MRLLLDTHVFLWSLVSPGRVPRRARRDIEEAAELVVSSVVAWEVAIKSGLGRLPLPDRAAVWVPWAVGALGARSLPISQDDALAVADLPPLHADPFDRLLVAQARRHELTLVTADRKLDGYEVELLWAD